VLESTASAAPAGTRVAPAASITSESARRNSSFKDMKRAGLVGFQRVRADDLREFVGPMRGRLLDRPHFIKADMRA